MITSQLCKSAQGIAGVMPGTAAGRIQQAVYKAMYYKTAAA